MNNPRLARRILFLALLAAVSWLVWKRPWITETHPTGLNKVVVNEAARTVLYLPIYHARERGYFKDEGLDVEIVTGGTATAAFSAILNGEADFAVADPMYVPISQQNGGDTRVIAQIVARIAVWGVARGNDIPPNDSTALKGKKIATHQRPMTAYTYTVKTLKDAGLDPEKDVTLITGTPGSEFAAFSSGEANVMFSLEPNTSRAILAGGTLIRSFPTDLGDQVFTGLLANSTTLNTKHGAAKALVKGIQKALDDLHANPEAALSSARIYFPQVEDAVLKAAISRLVDEHVVPTSVSIPALSWDKAIKVRVEAGDLKRAYRVEESCDFTLLDAR